MFSFLYLSYFSLWWEASFSKDTYFPGLFLVVLCGILRLVLSLLLEEFGGVAVVFTMERIYSKECFL